MSDSHGGAALSVIVPTHDVGSWIAETLTSILAQDIEHMEVIVVDDHSTDDTRSIVLSVAESDGRVRLIESPHRGGGTARNLGVEASSGRYLVFADGDDIVPRGAYAALMRSLEQSGSEIAFGDFLKFSPTDTWRPTQAMEAYRSPSTGIRLTDAPTLILARPCWNKMFRREFWMATAIHFPDVARSNDIVPMVRAYTAARSIDIVPDVVYLYRERPGTGSMSAKGGSGTALLSYLGQELQCARMVEDLDDEGVSNCYRRLVWDRDTWVHLSRYALQREEPHGAEKDDLVAAALADVLAVTGPCPREVSAHKSLFIRLCAAGQWDAASAALRLQQGNFDEETSPIRCWATLLPQVALVGDETWLDARAQWMIARDLQATHAETDDASWLIALRSIEQIGGLGVTERISEIAETATPAPGVRAMRREVDGALTAMVGGRELVLAGTSLVGADSALPVLWAPGSPAATVQPTRVEWLPEEDRPGYAWVATFARRSLPQHRRFEVAMQLPTTGSIVVIPSRAELPIYSPLDPFIFESQRSVAVIYRRRSGPVRMARRMRIIVRDRLARRAQR